MMESSNYQVCFIPTGNLRPNENTSQDRVNCLRDKILSEGLWKTPILAEFDSLSILDGHHRTEVAKLIGLAEVPVVLIDYSDRRLGLSARRDDVNVSRAEVIRRSFSGELYPKKTTRHVLKPCIQDTRIPLAELYGKTGEISQQSYQERI